LFVVISFFSSAAERTTDRNLKRGGQAHVFEDDFVVGRFGRRVSQSSASSLEGTTVDPTSAYAKHLRFKPVSISFGGETRCGSIGSSVPRRGDAW
jgi:hypothetical protein